MYIPAFSLHFILLQVLYGQEITDDVPSMGVSQTQMTVVSLGSDGTETMSMSVVDGDDCIYDHEGSLVSCQNRSHSSNATVGPTLPSTEVPMPRGVSPEPKGWDVGCTFHFSESRIPECNQLPHECLNCSYHYGCVYGSDTYATCSPPERYPCHGDRLFNKTFSCRYCYQTDQSEHFCSGLAGCRAAAAPRQNYRSNCTVHPNVTCLGNRQFSKNLPCNWTSGYRWSYALFLSIVGGGFGADRFYLGYWQEGIGKLFSFGGLGVWTLVDAVLIGVRFLKPADGSLYID